LAEPLVGAPGADASASLRQKKDFIVVAAAAELGLDIGHGSRRDLRQAAAALGARLPEAFQGLAALLRWVETGGPWPRITSAHPSYFYPLRAKANADRDHGNMPLDETSPPVVPPR